MLSDASSAFTVPHDMLPPHPDDLSAARATPDVFPSVPRDQRRNTPSPRPPALTMSLLPFVRVRVPTSNIRTNDKGKEVVSFDIDVALSAPSPAQETTTWRIEKTVADINALDAAMRTSASKSERHAFLPPPDKSLFKDHSPARSDHRKAVVEQYLQTLLATPMKDKDALCQFFNTDVVAERLRTNPSSGEMEGWLTKKGRGFTGGWLVRLVLMTRPQAETDTGLRRPAILSYRTAGCGITSRATAQSSSARSRCRTRRSAGSRQRPLRAAATRATSCTPS